MLDLTKVEIRKWTNTLAWISLRRDLVRNVASASFVKEGPNAFSVLAVCTSLACLVVALLMRLLGLDVVPSGEISSDSLFDVLPGFAKATASAAASVEALHPTAWATAILVLVGSVLACELGLVVLARLPGRWATRLQPPSHAALWLGTAGNLCLLAGVSFGASVAYSLLELLWPRVRYSFVPEMTFYAVLLLATGWMGYLIKRRSAGRGSANQWWEVIAMIPTFFVLLCALTILPGFAELHRPRVDARAPRQCDMPSRTCTVALDLSDAGVYELDEGVQLSFEFPQDPSKGRRSSVRLHATWLDEPLHEGIPIRLNSDEVRYVRLRFDDDRARDVCLPASVLDAMLLPGASSIVLGLDGRILGKEGRAEAAHIDATVRSVPGTWMSLATSICLSRQPSRAPAPPPAAATTK